ncbi:hypothetical protein [Methanobacterium alcaliphilum]|nr:hypothetical protein [Methanobacterium alcaliphilum]
MLIFINKPSQNRIDEIIVLEEELSFALLYKNVIIGERIFEKY